MQIVIKISDSLYSKLIDMNSDSDTCSFNESALVESIQNGIPLPKGHGKLIDADKIQFENNEFDTYSDYIKAFNAIYYAPTIIPADKEK